MSQDMPENAVLAWPEFVAEVQTTSARHQPFQEAAQLADAPSAD